MFEWDFGLVTYSDCDEDGFIGLQVDAPGEAKAGVATGEMNFPFGMYARPHDPSLDASGTPDAANSCSALYSYYGSRLHVWPLTDPRFQAKLPRVTKGGSVFYGGKKEQPAFVHIDGTSGSLDVYVPYAFSAAGVAAKAMSFTFNVRPDGAEEIALVHGSGMALTLIAGGKKSAKLSNAAGNAWLETNDDGNVINGNTKVVGGMSVGLPAATSVALATPLATYLAALEAVLVTIAAGTVVPAGPNAAVAAFQAAMGPVKALLAAQHLKST